ncbi:DUF1801 domain-containing protein [Planktosalinus lacus]|uniref:YdhG-like domain-containing protein n=1 Tax=Planktosalinus lacus TaxID=1526573 RepID=A0A8J2VBA3_9FLAO|nr:DUF1801 domain-containing protein [Planktosalinus lacus]GGD95310.1 hypothetical protein GCM10011312_18720 [Planktosalinus lacus]
MQSKATSPEAYISELPEERKEAFTRLRQTILNNLPKGFEETMSYGMISYVVPHSLYPDGYHCDPKQPLPFISIASQKNYIALYHYGLYTNPKLHDWFVTEYPKHSKYKLDMGKSCVRFKKPDAIPFNLLEKLLKKITPQQWIELYESQMKT